MTPLHAWLHPRKTVRRLMELENELNKLREECEVLQRNNQQQITELREKTAVANGEASRALEQLSELRNKYNKLKQQAEREQQRKSTLFVDYQSDINELKAGYERRLEHLRHALADANALLADRRDYDALQQMTLIDMTPETPAIAKPQEVTSKQQPPVPVEPKKTPEWLEPLPD